MFLFTAQIPKSRFIKVVNITSRTALIQWQKIPVKKEMYAEILGYKVVITREGIQQNFTTTSNESHIILEDLSQNTTYGVTIRGFSSYGDGPVSDQINFTTLGKHALYLLFKAKCYKKCHLILFLLCFVCFSPTKFNVVYFCLVWFGLTWFSLVQCSSGQRPFIAFHH